MKKKTKKTKNKQKYLQTYKIKQKKMRKIQSQKTYKIKQKKMRKIQSQKTYKIKQGKKHLAKTYKKQKFFLQKGGMVNAGQHQRQRAQGPLPYLPFENDGSLRSFIFGFNMGEEGYLIDTINQLLDSNSALGPIIYLFGATKQEVLDLFNEITREAAQQSAMYGLLDFIHVSCFVHTKWSTFSSDRGDNVDDNAPRDEDTGAIRAHATIWHKNKRYHYGFKPRDLANSIFEPNLVFWSSAQPDSEPSDAMKVLLQIMYHHVKYVIWYWNSRHWGGQINLFALPVTGSPPNGPEVTKYNDYQTASAVAIQVARSNHRIEDQIHKNILYNIQQWHQHGLYSNANLALVLTNRPLPARKLPQTLIGNIFGTTPPVHVNYAADAPDNFRTNLNIFPMLSPHSPSPYPDSNSTVVYQHQGLLHTLPPPPPPPQMMMPPPPPSGASSASQPFGAVPPPFGAVPPPFGAVPPPSASPPSAPPPSASPPSAPQSFGAVPSPFGAVPPPSASQPFGSAPPPSDPQPMEVEKTGGPSFSGFFGAAPVDPNAPIARPSGIFGAAPIARFSGFGAAPVDPPSMLGDAARRDAEYRTAVAARYSAAPREMGAAFSPGGRSAPLLFTNSTTGAADLGLI
jgi:hypothetical protein